MLVVGLKLKTQLLGKHILTLSLLWKWIKYLFVLFVLTICIKKMPGVMSIAMKSIRTTLLTLKETGVGPPFPKTFIIHPRKKKNQNDVEFEFSIGHAFVLFDFF